MRRMTRNKGRTDSEAEGMRDKQTIETQLQRQTAVKVKVKLLFFLIDFLLVLVIFCHYVRDRKL